jgi:hypothetical protein
VAAGLPGLRIRDLRHTAVALRIAAGASPKEVAARAGHTSVSFVLDRYGHLFPESDAALRDRLDALFRQATEHGRLRTGKAPSARVALGALACGFHPVGVAGLNLRPLPCEEGTSLLGEVGNALNCTVAHITCLAGTRFRAE